MAYSFARVSSQYLQYGAALITGRPATFFAHCYFTEDAPSAAMSLIGVGDTSYAYRFFTLYINTDREVKFWERSTIGGTSNLGTSLYAPANQWNRIAVAWEQSVAGGVNFDDVYVQLNTTLYSGTTTARFPSELNCTVISRNSNGSGSQYFNGSIAEAAMWNVRLSSGELAALGRGYSPMLIRPQSCVGYWDLLRRTTDKFGLYNMTAYNTPTQADHAPVIYGGQLG